MYTRTSYRPRVVTPIVSCAIGLLLWSCSSAPHDATAVSYSCAAPPVDLAGCAVDSDCATVALGCYCGAQPVNGVAHKYAPTAQACEDTAASMCALGCATQPQLVVQDGTRVDLGTTLAAHCDHSGATGVCKSYVPPGGGSGDPMPGGW
jgi:hypothetical protein